MKRHFVEGNYFATGEGLAVWISFEMAKSKGAAVKKAIKRFKVDPYFERTFSATVVEDNKEAVLERLRQFVPKLAADLVKHHGEFAMNFHFNKS